jgi:flagellar L-ring protein precursor FlgH
MQRHTSHLLRLAPLALALFGAVPLTAQNLFLQRQRPASWYADHRASAVGDILTIVVKETHKVKNEDKVDRSSRTDLSAALNTYTLSENTFKSNTLPKIDLETERSQEGQAKQEKDSQVTASIAVVVVDVQPNGNLVVAGTRIVKVDDEEKTLRVSGIVRPLDVGRDNTVVSSQVADARIAITGNGANTRAVTRGPVATLLDTMIWAAWPF